MLEEGTKIFVHHQRHMRNKAVPIIQQAANEDPELFIQAHAQITAAVYSMRDAIVRCNTQLPSISYFIRSQRRRNADMAGGKRKRVRQE